MPQQLWFLMNLILRYIPALMVRHSNLAYRKASRNHGRENQVRSIILPLTSTPLWQPLIPHRVLQIQPLYRLRRPSLPSMQLVRVVVEGRNLWRLHD